MVVSVRTSSVIRFALLCGVVLLSGLRGQAQEFPIFREPQNWFNPGPQKMVCPVPNMIGDGFVNLTDLFIQNDTNVGLATVPMAGGADRLVISRNNSARPQDRIYLHYGHLTGGLTGSANFPGVNRTEVASLDRYVLGIERSCLEGRASLEIRMPYASQRDFDFGSTAFSVRNYNYQGDLSAIGKFILSETESSTISAGVAIQLPSAGDVTGTDRTTAFTIDHDAIYISPFVAFSAAQADWFYNGFIQADFNVVGDGFTAGDVSNLPNSFQTGTYNPQNLLRISYGAGKWFTQNYDREWFRGLAGIVEMHYTGTLNDTDTVVLSGPTSVRVLTNRENRQHFFNLTAGLHMEVRENINTRVGVSVPLRDRDRQFDATFMVQVDVLLR